MDKWIARAEKDLRRAVEQGDFAVETPTVYAEQDDLHGFSFGASRHAKPFVSGFWVLEIDFRTRDMEILELWNNGNPSDIILHGDQHLWSTAIIDDLMLTVEPEEIKELSVSFEVQGVEHAGWQQP